MQVEALLNAGRSHAPGSWAHLISRFFTVISATPLSTEETHRVAGWLSPDEVEVFGGQPAYDQRHGLAAAALVAGRVPDRGDLIRAALLHDIGKRHARLGPIGRSLASAWVKLGGAASGRWFEYLDHGPRGAEELERLGAGAIVVAFAREHHGQRPIGISEEDWKLLLEADCE